MQISGIVPKIISILAAILVAVALAIFGFNAIKNVTAQVTNGAENAISSVTGQNFDINGDGSSGGAAAGYTSDDVGNLGQNATGGLNFN